ncbi:MAG TPA: hypothetical protein VMD91_02130 [Candidatus Sulfotelmatobacter sp.]|nr:hypothetical protein [Candidatus Sulfotelmatobacter sp.]
MQQILTVAGGLIAVYIILALIVSQVVEWINTTWNMRGKLLYKGILEMLSARRNAGGSGQTLVTEIYAHPLVGNLGLKQKPSYIGARTFTVSLIAALRTLPAQPGKQLPPVPNLSADGVALLNDLQARVAAVFAPNDPVGKSLGLVIEQTENVYESVLGSIDAWFNAQMDRITGTFKRYSAYFQIGLAAIIVYVLRVDTLALVGQLNTSSAAQSAIAVAQGLQNGTTSLDAALQALAKYDVIPSNLTFPAAWQPPHDVKVWVGMAITWFAILLGAPFWFDVLKRFTPVRLTGPKIDPQAAAQGDQQAVPSPLAGPAAP